MRKLIAAILVACTALAVPAFAADNDVNGPPCRDIVRDAGFGYANDGTVTLAFALAEPACKQIDYSVFVVTAEGEQALNQVGTNATGEVLIFMGTVDPDTNPSVGFYATTASKGGHVFDRAPDTGTASVAKGNSGGFIGFG